MSVLLAKNVDVSKLSYSAPKLLTNGSRSVYINYNGDKLMLQTPVMNLPYGLGDWSGKDAKPGEAAFKKYDMHVSFRGMDINPALKSLHDKMLEIEAKIKQDAFENRLAWLKDDYDGLKVATDRLFTPIVKYDKDRETGKVVGKYPPTIKLKIPYDNNSNQFEFECMDMNDTELVFDHIMNKIKGARARLIIQLSGLWFAGGKYGCTWRVVKSKFQLNSVKAVDFVEDDDDVGLEEEDDSTTPTGGNEDDNDDGEDEDSEDIPSPPPIKRPVAATTKKTITAKK